MANTNVVVLTGRCTRAAELKYTPAGTPICSFSIAVNERTKKKGSDEYESRPNFFDITCFGNYGKAMQPFLTRGKEVTVTGKLHQDRWEADGNKYSRIGIIASNVEPQREPKAGGGSAGGYAPPPAGDEPAPYEQIEGGEEIPF